MPMGCRWSADGVPMGCRRGADGVPMGSKRVPAGAFLWSQKRVLGRLEGSFRRGVGLRGFHLKDMRHEPGRVHRTGVILRQWVPPPKGTKRKQKQLPFDGSVFCGTPPPHHPSKGSLFGLPRGGQGCPGVPRRRPRGVGRAHTPGFHRCAKTIENISRIRMVVARASGTLIASSLKQNTFLTLKVRPAGGSPPLYGRSPKGRVGEGGSPPYCRSTTCPA